MMRRFGAQSGHQTANIQATGRLTDDQPARAAGQQTVNAVGTRQQRRNGPAASRIGTIAGIVAAAAAAADVVVLRRLVCSCCCCGGAVFVREKDARSDKVPVVFVVTVESTAPGAAGRGLRRVYVCVLRSLRSQGAISGRVGMGHQRWVHKCGQVLWV